MKYFKHKFPKPLLAGIVSLTMLTSTASAVDPVLTDTQLHTVLGVVTNFILDEETKNYKPPKKTGQVNSYNVNGDQIFDGSLKDDGFYQTGITPNYTRDDGNEIVTDHVTGLQWQDNLAASTTQKPWLDANVYSQCQGIGGFALDRTKCYDTTGDTVTSYCSNLILGGETDWRLPTGKELLSLSDYGQVNPTIDPTFQNTASSYYWSSNTALTDDAFAMEVNFVSGDWDLLNKVIDNYVRCVRAGDEVTPPDFTKTGNIVTDNTTGLQWQDDAAGNKKTQRIAIDYCEALNLDGFNDWRLPNLNELNSLIDESTYDPSIFAAFQNTAPNPSRYWSSTTYVGVVSSAWSVNFSNGGYGLFIKSGSNYVRCVRAGQ